jgi:predicted O-linked N-acetylglucosamine transferase (SPINDLY family)
LTSVATRLIEEGIALEDRGDFVQALARFRRAAEADPRNPRAWLNVGNALRALGQLDASAAAFRAAIDMAPGYVPALFNLGALLTSRGQYGAAEAELREALRVDPHFAQAAIVLADVAEATGRTPEAEAWLRRALDLSPGDGGALLNLAHLLLRANRFAEAETCFLRASALGHDVARDALSSYCFALSLRDDLSPQAIFEAHRRVGLAVQRSAGQATAHRNAPDPERRLRLGYVSSDFRRHPIGLFMRLLLPLHDRDRFEVHAWSGTAKIDAATDAIRNAVDLWHDIAGMPDRDVDALVRAAQIDVMVDLGGHTDGTRLPVFARAPAPVQASWLGYLNTTGLPTIGYRLCDRHTDPPGETESLYTEALCRLPHSQWCYAPWDDAASVATPASRRSEGIVFGSFNQFGKIGETCLDLWARVLAAVPDAGLRVLDVAEERLENALLDKLERRGVDRRRVATCARLDIASYFRAIAEADVALDTTPYNGATTTLDTLWMGTPVVALRGNRALARGSYSIMRSLGAAELIAGSEDEYVALNVRLARDARWRETLRSALRDRLVASPLMDAPRFVASLESAYRRMWRAWCRARPPAG